MSLIVKGFKKQDVVNVEQIVEAVSRIPKKCLVGLNSLVYDPTRFYQKSYADPKPINYRVAGEYDSSPIDHILIYKFRSHEEFVHILYHEVGHHVFRRNLDSVKRKKWVTGVYPNSIHVTEYAKTNASEDFAETFAFFIKKSSVLNTIPNKLKFMREEVLA